MQNIQKTALIVASACALFIPMKESRAECFPQFALQKNVVTSPYGFRIHPVHKKPKLHGGTDFRAATGTKTVAVNGGTVISTNYDNSGGGNILSLRPDGTQGYDLVMYMHLHQFIRAPKDKVKVGEVVALTGNTGVGTAAHLHLATKLKGAWVNSGDFLCGSGNAGANQEGGFNSDSNVTGATSAPNTEATTENQVGPGAGSAGGVVDPSKIPLSADYPSLSSLSINQFLSSESNKRFGSASWFEELNDPAAKLREDPRAKNLDPAAMAALPKFHMLRELNTMMAIKNLMDAKLQEQRDIMETQSAAILSIDARDYASKVQSIISNNIGSRR